jgi:hypothetical protein
MPLDESIEQVFQHPPACGEEHKVTRRKQERKNEPANPPGVPFHKEARHNGDLVDEAGQRLNGRNRLGLVAKDVERQRINGCQLSREQSQDPASRCQARAASAGPEELPSALQLRGTANRVSRLG